MEQKDNKEKYSMKDLLIKTVSLCDVHNDNDRKTLFIKKLKLCCIVCDFTVLDSKYELAKEMKRAYLLELVKYASRSKEWFSEEQTPFILEMISLNLFRCLPPPLYQDFDPEQDEPNYDPSWSHLQFIYEFFHRFIATADIAIIRRYINKRFILNIIDLFKSEDPRERDYLKMVLHRMYGRCMPFRLFIRKAIHNALYPIIYSNAVNVRHNGISELLEILASIINGFAIPLKKEHVLFLQNVLIPIHKISYLPEFHHQLSQCITQFIQKDRGLAIPVICGLLRFWPNASYKNELLFLDELEQVLLLTDTKELENIIEPLFNRISKLILSTHSQVAERTLVLWHQDIIAVFTADHRHKILPIIYPALQRHTHTKHWYSEVSSSTLLLMQIFKEIDQELYQKVAKQYEELNITNKKQKREQKWKRLLQIATNNRQKLNGTINRI